MNRSAQSVAIQRLFDAGAGVEIITNQSRTASRNKKNLQKRRWTRDTLADALGWSTGTTSTALKGDTSISEAKIEDLIRVFFPDDETKAKFWDEYVILKGGRLKGITIDQPIYSKKDVWRILTRPIKDNVSRLVVESSGFDNSPGMKSSHISAKMTGSKFFLQPPDWFVNWAGERVDFDDKQAVKYETREAIDLGGSNGLEHLYNSYPLLNLPHLIADCSEQYAQSVRNSFDNISRRASLYNKPKIGISSWRQAVPGNLPERSHLELQCYITDYFTHRVMRLALNSLRKSAREFMRVSDINGLMDFIMPYFTTSLGVNVVVVTNDKPSRLFHMTVTSALQGNVNQTNKIHVSANEGANDEDIRKGFLNVSDWVDRALDEELGIPRGTVDYKSDVLFTEFSLEMTNFELFFACVVHLDRKSDDLIASANFDARDHLRETNKVLKQYPYSSEGIVDMLINTERGYNDFTSYSLNIFDLILHKNLSDRAKF